MPSGQPSSIGRYTVQRVLGRGGMGTVYLATDPLLDREVAIKVLPAAIASPEEGRRLLAEARVSARLVHPHIVSVFDIGEQHGQPFVVMQYFPGRTLASVLTSGDRPPLATKLQWMAQLCDGLAFAHDARVIHRDVKPSNLLIDQRGTLRILDFGIAKVLATTQLAFTSVGTPAYMAPEQYSSEPVDPRTDVFAAGLVLYELITHRRALDGDTPAKIYGQLMQGRLPRLQDAVPDADPALAAVCERAMARDPGDRYQTARAFGDAVDAVRTTPATVMAPVMITVPTLVGVPTPAPEKAVTVGKPAQAALPTTIRARRPAALRAAAKKVAAPQPDTGHQAEPARTGLSPAERIFTAGLVLLGALLLLFLLGLIAAPLLS
jgi:serine/threonine protein kinase